jgi:hypothetical protein
MLWLMQSWRVSGLTMLIEATVSCLHIVMPVWHHFGGLGALDGSLVKEICVFSQKQLLLLTVFRLWW